MTEQPKAPQPKPEEKSKYYFKIIPKEEFPKFIERLKAALAKIDNKKGDKKSIEFEISGSKDELKGLALEIFTFDKTKCAEFLDVEQDYIKNSLYCVSLILNAKTEEDIPKIEGSFATLQNLMLASPVKDKVELHFRKKGKQVFFDSVSKNGKLVEALLGLGINLSEFHKFNFALKSGINVEDIFNPMADQTANIINICSLLLSIKSETENVRYLSGALAEALKDIKIEDELIKAKFNKFVGFLNFVNSFVGAKLKLEYDAKTLAGEGAKEAEKKAGGTDDLKTKIAGAQMMAMGFGSQMIPGMLESFGIKDIVKALDLDSISISLGVPNYQNGYAITIKAPGVTKVLGQILDGAPQAPK